MTIDDKIRDEKIKCDINREAAKISASSSGKIDKYKYLTDAEILPPNQCRMIEQAKFTYSPLGKALEKQTKTIEDQERKQIDANMNQNKRQVVLINKDDKSFSHKEIFENLLEKGLMKY